MEAITPGRTTVVVTTTPSVAFGLEELNAALCDGWRIIHLAVLGHTGPGEDDAWPDGHFSALVLLENVGRLSRRGSAAHSHVDASPQSSNASGSNSQDMRWPDYAI